MKVHASTREGWDLFFHSWCWLELITIAVGTGESTQKKKIKMLSCGEESSGEVGVGQQFPYIKANPSSNRNQT